ncbi:hypothetical protein L3X38_003608 [Prunus dulcis]|uniref:Uncharacterized protein n=1 Tax=Prunus dulcis TaxID=3755 RepID=A0AAD5F264_PRUDU|nr:hypothetical protein L3X38_003608 [Prunus dulcis]
MRSIATPTLLKILIFFPLELSQPENDQSHVERHRSPMTLPEKDRSQPDNDQLFMTLLENDWSQLGSDRLLPENQPQPDLSSLCCPTQEEEIDEILPTLETSSAPVPLQSPADDVIQELEVVATTPIVSVALA